MAATQQLKPSKRSAIRSFKVMDVVAKADRLAREGRDIFHLEVGQPQSSAPSPAVRIAQEQLGSDRCGYTAARGEPPLREAIARMVCLPPPFRTTQGQESKSRGPGTARPSLFQSAALRLMVRASRAPQYSKTYEVTCNPQRIHLTPGSSGAFTIAFMAAFDVGDVVAVPSSSYPCYRNLLTTYGCVVASLPVNNEYNLTARELTAAQADRAARGLPPIKGLILSSPANPTGAMLAPEELRELCGVCESSGVQFISDELYHGITYQGAPRAATALEFTRQAIIINGFSKAYSMTGWRLGWLIVPDHLDACVDALNVRSCASPHASGPML